MTYSLSVTPLLVGALAIGCRMPSAVVRVDGFPSGDPSVTRAAPVCFTEPRSLASANLGIQTQYRDIASVCSRVVAQEGLTVVPQGSPGCLAIMFGWRVSGGTQQVGSETQCFGFGNVLRGGTTMCTSEPKYGASYRKFFRVTVMDPPRTRQIHQIDAALISNFADMRDETVVALCRAAFQDYPQRVKGAQYEPRTGL